MEQQQGLITELEQRFLDLKQQNTMIETMMEAQQKKEMKCTGNYWSALSQLLRCSRRS